MFAFFRRATCQQKTSGLIGLNRHWMNLVWGLLTTLSEILWLRSACSKRSIRRRNHWLQLKFPAKVGQAGLPVQGSYLLAHALHTFWFLQKQNIRNLPYRFCALCTPPESFPSTVKTRKQLQ